MTVGNFWVPPIPETRTYDAEGNLGVNGLLGATLGNAEDHENGTIYPESVTTIGYCR
jgi:hypothetical protein